MSSVNPELLPNGLLQSKKCAQEPSPELDANCISKLLYCWVWSFLCKGNKKDLILEDVYQPRPQQGSSKQAAIFLKEWERAQGDAKKPVKLWRLVLSLTWREFSVVALGHCVDDLVLRMAAPFLLKELIKTFQTEEESSMRTILQVVCASGLVLISLLHTILFQKLVDASICIGIRLRLQLSSLIYARTLTLGRGGRDGEEGGGGHVGKVVNLLAKDADFDTALILLPCLLIAPIQFLILGYLLWAELGLASLAGSGCILLMLPIHVSLGRFSMYFRTRIASWTDKRGRLISELIGAIRLVKMCTWEKPFAALVSQLRKSESKFIRRHLYLRALFLSVKSVFSKLIPFCVLVVYVLLGNPLTPDKAFFTISVLSITLQAVMSRIPNCASQLGELAASLNRIDQFLAGGAVSCPGGADGHEGRNLEDKSDSGGDTLYKPPSIVLANYTGRWTKGSSSILHNLNVNLSGDQLVMVIGSVGSGKSSFLNAILSELRTCSGTCVIRGRLSYSAQEPWIFPASLRSNILFGLEMEEERYWNIIKLACLSHDLAQFPSADLTLVGEKGICLSGGQKARVSLARALYQEADIYLFDDPLSAVDPKLSKTLFHGAIKGRLSGKLRILVTHQLQYLPFADHIIVLNTAGQVESQGSYKELMANGINLPSLVGIPPSSANGEEQIAPPDDLPLTENEEKWNGEDGQQQLVDEDKTKMLTKPSKTEGEEGKQVGSVGISIYYRYLRSGKSPVSIVLLVLLFLGTQFLYNFLDFWVSLWTNAVVDKGNLTTTSTTRDMEGESHDDEHVLYLSVYYGLMALFIVATVIRSLLFFWYCLRISLKLHDSMFSGVVHTPLKFFDDNPSGRILNRFTRDINHVDEPLPLSLYDYLSVLLMLGGMVAVNMVVNPYAIIPCVLFLWLLWKLRSFYLATARDLKRIEALTKSPIFTHVTSTMQGLTTIRAVRAEARMTEQFHKLQDTHLSVFHMINMTNRWFGNALEFLSTALLAAVSFGFIFIIPSTSGGSVGVAISTILTLSNTLQWGIRQSADTENHMTSVERIVEYSNLPREAPLETKADSKLPHSWPKQGSIEFERVCLSYSKDIAVLKSVSFRIHPGEKIGVVGRSGAGKSSLLAALFRLTEPEGVIRVDGVPIGNLGLHTLRSKISIIPQDPVLIRGSLRYNLDPFGEHSDPKLWSALGEVQLQNAISSLDHEVADGGSNFSTGQKQLLCLARAILRENRIICLDEPTSNVDPVTDQLVQETVGQKFSSCTILTIAHRLQTVMSCDRIMVVQDGQIVEFDSPSALLTRVGGTFSKMWGQSLQCNERQENAKKVRE